MSTPFDNNPQFRKILYKIQWTVSGVMFLIGVGYGAAGHGLPSWYGVASAVLAALWSYTGAQADTNTLTKMKDVVKAAKRLDPSVKGVYGKAPEDETDW